MSSDYAVRRVSLDCAAAVRRAVFVRQPGHIFSDGGPRQPERIRCRDVKTSPKNRCFQSGSRVSLTKRHPPDAPSLGLVLDDDRGVDWPSRGCGHFHTGWRRQVMTRGHQQHRRRKPSTVCNTRPAVLHRSHKTDRVPRVKPRRCVPVRSSTRKRGTLALYSRLSDPQSAIDRTVPQVDNVTTWGGMGFTSSSTISLGTRRQTPSGVSVGRLFHQSRSEETASHDHWPVKFR